MSAQLIDNTFNDLFPHSKPPWSQFQLSPGSIDASLPVSTLDSEQNFMPWLCLRSYEQLLIRNSENSEEKDAQATSTLRKKGLSDLKLP